MTFTDIRPARFPWLRYSGYTFSLGLSDPVTGAAYLSGHSGSGYDPRRGKVVVPAGMGAQAEVAYAKIGVLLEAAGLGWADVTLLVENVAAAGLDSYREAEEVRRRTFPGPAPVVRTVVVERLLRPGALVEVEATAARTSEALPGDLRSGPDHTVHLPSLLPVDASGTLVAEGDFAGQYRSCLEQAASLLAAAGLGLSHVVKTVDFALPAAVGACSDAAKVRGSLLGPVLPATVSILTRRLPVPGALVSLDVTASHREPVLVDAGWEPDPATASSSAVRAGRTLHLSGITVLDPDTPRPDDIGAQADAAYGILAEVLDAAGLGPEQLVRTVEYVTPAGLPGYRAVADVRARQLGRPYPASTGVVCAGLPGQDVLFEVDATAVFPA